MRLFVFGIFLFLLMCSCERKSGRRASGLDRSKKEYSNKRKSTNRMPVTPISVATGNSQRKILSGSAIFEKYTTAVFMIYVSSGSGYSQGSGFFITNSGVAISNYHVFEGSTIGNETIKLLDGQNLKVKEVISYSKESDYIIFRVNVGTSRVNCIPISVLQPKVGEKVYAIGSPQGLENTFSSGEISQIRQNNLLQISVPIDHGSSGGPLINSYGEVVGITTGGLDESGANLNFAVDISVIRHILKGK